MMRASATSARYRRVLLGLVFLLALCTRAERAIQQPVVNPDAIRFIDQAQRLPTDPLGALRGEAYHPLHAMAALLVHAVTHGWFRDDRVAWLAAVQSVGVVCGALVALQIISLASLFGAPFWAAVGAGLVWIVGRRTSSYGADGLSDMLFLCLFAASMITAMQAMRFREGRLSRGQMGAFGLSGFLAGLAYLARPEGLAAPLIVCVTLVLLTVRHPGKVPRALKVLPRRQLSPGVLPPVMVCLLAGVLVPALPYMLIIGGITQKKPIEVSLPVVMPWEAAGMGPAKALSPSAVEKIGRELLETFGFAPLIALGGAMLLKPRLWGRARLRPLVIVWSVLWSVVMLWLIHRASYLDGRHTLPLQLVLHGLLALAFVTWEKPMRWWMGWWRRKPVWGRLPAWMRWGRWPYVFAAGAISLTLLPGVIRLKQPPGEEQAYVRDAASWVNGHLKPEVVIWDRPRLVGYYSGHPYAQWLGSPGDPLLDEIDPHRPGVLAYIFRPGLNEMPQRAFGRYVAVAAFASAKALHGDVLVLYAIPGSGVFKGEPAEPLTTFPAASIVP